MLDLTEKKTDVDNYGKDYFKQLLIQRHGTKIYFVSRPGWDDVIGFSKFCDLILHDKFFLD